MAGSRTQIAPFSAVVLTTWPNALWPFASNDRGVFGRVVITSALWRSDLGSTPPCASLLFFGLFFYFMDVTKLPTSVVEIWLLASHASGK